MFQDGSEAPPTYSRPSRGPCQQGTLAVRARGIRTAGGRARDRGLGATEVAPNSSPALGPPPSGSSREARRRCSRADAETPGPVLADRRPSDPRPRRPGFAAPTSRTPPFATAQFHVLLNSLFKVLFNFPSRYLFAIGLGVIFSLTWSLPRTLSCTPKQLDSGEKASATLPPPYGPITLYGPWPQSRWTWTGRSDARRLSQTPHSARSARAGGSVLGSARFIRHY